MPPNFIYPDPNQDKVMQELDKLVKILQKPKSPELKKNIRILRAFSKSLFIVSHRGGKQAPSLMTPTQTAPIQETPQQPTQPLPSPASPAPPPPPPAPIAAPTTPKEVPQQTISQLKKESGKLMYNLIEPAMQQKDWGLYSQVKKLISIQLKKDPALLDNPNFLTGEITKAAKELKIKTSEAYIKKIAHHINKNLKGYGKIDPLIKDPRVKKITCRSYDDIEVEFENETLPTNIKFDTTQELNDFITNVAERNGKKVSDTKPKVEIKLDNMEIDAEYNPMTTSSFTITKI